MNRIDNHELDPTNNNQDPDDLVNLLEGAGLVDEDENAEDQEDFEMKKKTMDDITDAKDGGVLKRTIKAGLKSLPNVPEMAVVKIHYSLYLKGVDEPYDCTLLRGKAEKHSIGGGRLLPGLELGIRTMRKGEKAEILMDYPSAMGEFGCPPGILRKAQILAKVELIDYTEEVQADSFDELEKIAQLENSKGKRMEEVMCRNPFKDMYKNVTKTTPEPEVRAAVVEVYYDALKDFRNDPDQDVFRIRNRKYIATDMKEMLKAAAYLNLRVVLKPGPRNGQVLEMEISKS